MDNFYCFTTVVFLKCMSLWPCLYNILCAVTSGVPLTILQVVILNKYSDHQIPVISMKQNLQAGFSTSYAIAVYFSCICDLVISVGVLHLFHNNLVDCSWYIYCCEYYTTCQYQTTSTFWECRSTGWLNWEVSACTVLFSSLNMCL